jgi:hypothetical protein
VRGYVDRNVIVGFGEPSEWEGFLSRHKIFFERFAHLKNALQVAFLRTITSSQPAERVVFYWEDFALRIS